MYCTGHRSHTSHTSAGCGWSPHADDWHSGAVDGVQGRVQECQPTAVHWLRKHGQPVRRAASVAGGAQARSPTRWACPYPHGKPQSALGAALPLPCPRGKVGKVERQLQARGGRRCQVLLGPPGPEPPPSPLAPRSVRPLPAITASPFPGALAHCDTTRGALRPRLAVQRRRWMP